MINLFKNMYRNHGVIKLLDGANYVSYRDTGDFHVQKYIKFRH